MLKLKLSIIFINKYSLYGVVMKKIYLLLLLFSLLLKANNQLEITQMINNIFQEASQKKDIIAMSAHNKMLSQKIAKDVVMIVNGIDVEDYRYDLIHSTQTFNDFLLAMYEGNKERAITKTTDSEILYELEEIKDEWAVFCKHILKFYKKENKIDMTSYQYIINNNEKLLRLSHKLTQTLKSKNRLNTNSNKVMEHTLKIADRQKMLTQKMFKEKFLIYIGEDKKRNSIRLRGSIILFQNGLKGLIYGDKKRGLIAVSNPKIKVKLEKMWKLYQKVKGFYIQKKINKNEMRQLAIIERLLLLYATEIVSMIENTLEY